MFNCHLNVIDHNVLHVGGGGGVVLMTFITYMNISVHCCDPVVDLGGGVTMNILHLELLIIILMISILTNKNK